MTWSKGAGTGAGGLPRRMNIPATFLRWGSASFAVVVAGGDVVDGQSHDPWQGLGVQQDEQADDAFGQVYALAIVEAPDELDLLLAAAPS